MRPNRRLHALAFAALMTPLSAAAQHDASAKPVGPPAQSATSAKSKKNGRKKHAAKKSVSKKKKKKKSRGKRLREPGESLIGGHREEKIEKVEKTHGDAARSR